MKSDKDPIAVLVMAYGGPDKIEDVEPYLLDVRNHRETPDHLIEEVRERYKLIGGRSPILERTRVQADQLEHHLKALDARFQVFVGMRHWHPFLREAVADIDAAGFDRVIGIVMAPQYSRMSVEAYYERLDEAMESTRVHLAVSGIRSWNMAPGYLSCLEARVKQGLEQFSEDQRSGVNLIVTAHSLPERILSWEDPYPEELKTTFKALEQRFPGQTCLFAYQSAAMTHEPWLGPDAGDLMEERLKSGEADSFLVVPIGFVSEHVEILYDIDIDFKERIEGAGGHMKRVEMPGADAGMMASLAGMIQQQAQREGWL